MKYKKEKQPLPKIWKILIPVFIALFLISAGLTVYFLVWYDVSYAFDLDEYLSSAELVWYDDFDGISIDESKWFVEGSDQEGGKIPRRGGYWAQDAVSVVDGNLVITTDKRDDGHYYTGAVSTANTYSSKYGYYEIRCILPKGYGIWSAFWFMPPVFGDDDPGAEIDVFEAPSYPNEVTQQTVHVGGYGKNHKVFTNGDWLINELGDIYDDYHTYGLYWDDDILIFFVDGKKVWTTDLGGNVSDVNSYMLISVEIGGKVKDGVPTPGVAWGNPLLFKSPDTDLNDWSTSKEFKIDYVRHYQ